MSNAAEEIAGHGHGRAVSGPRSDKLAAQMEPFDSFWEGPENIEKGYRTFSSFYRDNYLRHVTPAKDAKILVVSCGHGYFVNVLNQEDYFDVTGIDSIEEKVAVGQFHGLNCLLARAFEYLALQDDEIYDVIFCEQELNHLTKDEMIEFLELARNKLKPGGQLICHGLNGANPIVGAETLAQNWDHQNSFTSYSMNQVLEHTGFEVQKIFGLHLYVFYGNPANYVAWGLTAALHLLFQILFKVYGKSNKIFQKKIAAVAIKPGGEDAPANHLRSI